MTLQKGQTIELDITDMAFGGRGIARVDGMTVFVESAVAGDRVEARIGRKRKKYAEARVMRILAPSADRVTPPCRYSGLCGGCKWQFLDYAKQLEYKQAHVRESVEHIGGLKDIIVHPTLPSERVFGYRNKMEFSCTDRRWLLPEEMGREDVDTGFALGLHVPGAFYKVLDIDACVLMPDAGNAILADIRSYMRESGAPPYGLQSHEGFWRFAMLRHSTALYQWMVNIVTSREDRGEVDPLAEMLLERHPRIVSVVNNITSRKAGIAVGESEILLAGQPFLTERLGRFEFDISANSFFQTNTSGAERLYRTVLEYARLQGDETVLDLYSGAGTIPIWISGAAREVVGMEIVESAVGDAGKNCRKNSVTNCRFIQGDIRQSLAGIGFTPDVIIIDPPRDGMHPDVLRQVLSVAPGRIVYVSCNPATLARDLGLMKERYRVEEIQPVDMFPHTFHIESVARLVKI